MKPGGRVKLGALVDRLVRAQAGGLAESGQVYLKQRLEYRFGLREKAPNPPGKPGAEREYVVQIIEQREERALELPGVADEVEAAGSSVRP